MQERRFNPLSIHISSHTFNTQHFQLVPLQTPALRTDMIPSMDHNNKDSLAERVLALPQELFDKIYDLTFTVNESGFLEITPDFHLPRSAGKMLCVDRASRAMFAKSFYGSCKAHFYEPIDLVRWLKTMPPEHVAMLRTVLCQWHDYTPVLHVTGFPHSVQIAMAERIAGLAELGLKQVRRRLLKNGLHLNDGVLRISICPFEQEGIFYTSEPTAELLLQNLR